jgi:uncharacterized protein YjiS (DUF1127 family)
VNGVAGTVWGAGVSDAATQTHRLPHWSDLQSLFTEWRHRIRSRYELECLSERDLADMGMTPMDAFHEIQKPFWQE